MKKYAPQIEAATRFTYITESEQCRFTDDKILKASVVCADSCIFDVLPRRILRGNPKEVLSKPYYCMVNGKFAEKLGKDAVGRRFAMTEYPGVTFTIGGIYEDFPRNSTLYPVNIILSLNTMRHPGQFDGTVNWVGNDRYQSYLRLRRGVTPSDIKGNVAMMIKDNFPLKDLKAAGVDIGFSFTGISKVYTSNKYVKNMSWILSILAFILLFSSVMNYLLIVAGNMVTRSREMAIRKCYGAEGNTIGSIAFCEALVHLLLAAVLAVVLLFCCKGSIEQFISAPLESLFSNKGSLIFIAICIIVIVLGGIVPGYMYASVPISSAFRCYHEYKHSWKHALLAIQFMAAGLMFCLLIVINRQYNLMLDENLGYDYSNLAVLSVKGTTGDQNYGLVNELKKIPGVKSVSSSDCLPNDTGQSGNNILLPGDDKEYFNAVDLYYVYDDYFKLMGIKILQGGSFTQGTDSLREVMVSKNFADKISSLAHWKDGAVGKKIMITEHSQSKNSSFTICGVYDDIAIGSFSDPDNRPSMMFYYRKPIGYILVKFDRLTADSMKKIRDLAESMFPDKDITVDSYDTLVADLYRPQKSFRSALLIAGIVTIMIALIGLVGYTGDEVNRRRKEIAVRKINGATGMIILGIFIRDISKVALPSLLISGVVAYFISAKWLTLFSVRISLNPLLFIVGIIVILIVIYITVIINCYRISVSNPVDYLKDE
jgi:putative ABC transport system permease protein